MLLSAPATSASVYRLSSEAGILSSRADNRQCVEEHQDYDLPTFSDEVRMVSMHILPPSLCRWVPRESDHTSRRFCWTRRWPSALNVIILHISATHLAVDYISRLVRSDARDMGLCYRTTCVQHSEHNQAWLRQALWKEARKGIRIVKGKRDRPVVCKDYWKIRSMGLRKKGEIMQGEARDRS